MPSPNDAVTVALPDFAVSVPALAGAASSAGAAPSSEACWAGAAVSSTGAASSVGGATSSAGSAAGRSSGSGVGCSAGSAAASSPVVSSVSTTSSVVGSLVTPSSACATDAVGTVLTARHSAIRQTKSLLDMTVRAVLTMERQVFIRDSDLQLSAGLRVRCVFLADIKT